MGTRGRPPSSIIRQNMVEVLAEMRKAYGYELYKAYVKIYPKVTLRSIYYHLKKGLLTGEFEQESVEREKGEYSWGEFAEKTYYKLGKNALVRKDLKAKVGVKDDKP